MSDKSTTIKRAKELLLRKNKTLAEQSARIAELEAIIVAQEEPAKHTPGDTWTYSGGLRGGCIMPDNIYSSPLTIRHEWGEPTPEGAIATANMQHAVRAVNCHDELLAALKALLCYANKYSDTMAKKHGRGAQGLGELADSVSVAGMARAAIAKAEGKPTC